MKKTVREFVVEFKINPRWVENVQLFAHNQMEATKIGRRYLEEQCGRVAARHAEIESVITIQG